MHRLGPAGKTITFRCGCAGAGRQRRRTQRWRLESDRHMSQGRGGRQRPAKQVSVARVRGARLLACIEITKPDATAVQFVKLRAARLEFYSTRTDTHDTAYVDAMCGVSGTVNIYQRSFKKIPRILSILLF